MASGTVTPALKDKGDTGMSPEDSQRQLDYDPHLASPLILNSSFAQAQERNSSPKRKPGARQYPSGELYGMPSPVLSTSSVMHASSTPPSPALNDTSSIPYLERTFPDRSSAG